MKNTLLDKTICNSQSHKALEQRNKQESEFTLIEIVTAPVRPLVFSATGLFNGGYYGFLAFSGLLMGPLDLFLAFADEDYEPSPINLPLGVVGGILGVPLGMICGFLRGIYDQGKMLINGLSYM